MGAREVVESFWAAVRANDWDGAAALFADDATIEWPCSGERMKSPRAWAEVQRRYPAAGEWRFDVHRLVVEGKLAVSEVTVTDGEQPARVVAFSEVVEERIARQVEYWPAAYEPAAWRADFVERIEPIP
jgi:ketosteroid isomerase-like protein